MSIRRFCDLCEREMPQLAEERTPMGRLFAKVQRGKTEFSVEVITGLNGCSNKGDFCKYCVLDELDKLDDRPHKA